MSENLKTVVNGNGETALHLVARINDVSMVREFLSQGADVNSRNECQRTPLHIAVLQNEYESHLKLVEALLKNNAEVDARDSSGKTPLYYLVVDASVRFVRLLLNFKADVNALTNVGHNLLFSVCWKKNLKVLKLLIDLGLDVNHRSHDGETPLHRACASSSENTEIIECLLENGANMNVFDNKEFSPGIKAIYNIGFYGRNTARAEEGMSKKLKFLIEYTDFLVIPEDVDIFHFYRDTYIPDHFWKCILKHLAKLEVSNITISSHLLNTISEKEEYNNYFKQCQQELLQAKIVKFENSWISLFDLLVHSEIKLKNYAGNKDLIEDFNKIECEKKFPIYGASMQENVEKGIKERELFDKSSIVLSYCLPIFNPNHLIIRDLLECMMSKKYLSKLCK